MDNPVTGITEALPPLLTVGGMKLTRTHIMLAAAALAVSLLAGCKDTSTASSAKTSDLAAATRSAAAVATQSSAGAQTSQPDTATPAASGTKASNTSAATGAAARLPAPCSLITAAEASASLGSSLTTIDSSADDDPDQISCSYLLNGNEPVLVVLIRDWSLARFQADAAQEPGKPQPITGIGTAAYIGANETGPAVFTWERGVSVLVNGKFSPDQVKFLAKVAVGQLDAPK